MSQTISIDKAAEHVRNIVDNNRCAICDKLNGKRMRYHCGHTSCEDCVIAPNNCPLFCLTPQDSCAEVLIDEPQTQRAQNAIILLNAFETDFNCDVYKRCRLSEQLKVERELFPQCIQAPAKYYNKRKSLNSFTENKENIPGERVSSISNMDNSNAYVRKWLNKYVKRKPLGDLNYSETTNTSQEQPLKAINTQNMGRSHRKRKHSEVWVDENQTYNDKYVAPSKKHNKENTVEKLIKTNPLTDLQKGKNKDDSGISIEDDGVTVIDDSQSVKVDKDMNAWLAVLEAEKFAKITQQITQPNNIPLKVPFYVRSPLSENCKDCSRIKTSNNDDKHEEQPNISITVESESFTAIINVSKAERSLKTNAKKSVEVQTEKLQNVDDQGFVDECILSENESDIVGTASPIPCSSKSKDQAGYFSPVERNKTSNVIIAESDSDEDVEHSTSLQVTADVHRSYDETFVLGDVKDVQEHTKRPRRAARGHTPTSTDSSEKENFNPNRKKRSCSSKKKPLKK